MRSIHTGIKNGDGLACAAAAFFPELRRLNQRAGLSQRRIGDAVFGPFAELRVVGCTSSQVPAR
jgi:hypothetical protein